MTGLRDLLKEAWDASVPLGDLETADADWRVKEQDLEIPQ